jgi:transcriptional regulator with XRE-family HTH domain
MAKPESRHQPNPKLLRAIASIIKELREKKKLTQEALAQNSGITWRYLQEIEAGATATEDKLKNISISIFFNLCKGLEVKPEELISLIRRKWR